MIENTDQRSKDYSEVAKAYRPGHADYAYDAKYGFRDYRGGGRSVGARDRGAGGGGRGGAAGDPRGDDHRLCLRDRRRCDRPRGVRRRRRSAQNPFFCPDSWAAARWEKLVDEARKDGSSLGAVVECVATGVPAGWGAPIYGKLDADLAAAMMGINAVKGVEIGEGFARRRPARRAERRPDAAGRRRQPRVHRQPRGRDRRRHFDRAAGGGAGGVQADQLDPDRAGHDHARRRGDRARAPRAATIPCVGIRGTPVVAAMMALVLADHKLLHRAQCG